MTYTAKDLRDAADRHDAARPETADMLRAGAAALDALDRANDMIARQSVALNEVRDKALEEAARCCVDASKKQEKIGLKHPENSPSRDRLFGRAREALYIADAIRALKDKTNG